MLKENISYLMQADQSISTDHPIKDVVQQVKTLLQSDQDQCQNQEDLTNEDIEIEEELEIDSEDNEELDEIDDFDTL